MLVSFRDDMGEYCRAFAGTSESGIACRDDTGWKLQYAGAGTAAQSTDYRMASSTAAELLARVQDMAAGPALDAKGEAAAKEKGWR